MMATGVGIPHENREQGVFGYFRHQKTCTVPYIDGGIARPRRIVSVTGDDDRTFPGQKAVAKGMNIRLQIVCGQTPCLTDLRVTACKSGNMHAADGNPPSVNESVNDMDAVRL